MLCICVALTPGPYCLRTCQNPAGEWASHRPRPAQPRLQLKERKGTCVHTHLPVLTRLSGEPSSLAFCSAISFMHDSQSP